MKRILSCILAFLFLISTAHTEGLSKRELYEMGLEMLYEFDTEDTSGLEAACEFFAAAGTFKNATDYYMYAEAMLYIANADNNYFGLDYAISNLEVLQDDESFTSSLEDNGYPSCEDLRVYIEGRKLEHYGDIDEALEKYKSINILDTKKRRALLTNNNRQGDYEAAMRLYNAGKYYEAAMAFKALGDYRDSREKYEDAIKRHKHDWRNADCEHPMTCRECGITQGRALGHDWKEATTSAPKTCRRCGATTGSPLPAEHVWVNATCTTPKTCKLCGITEGYALGHVYTSATCTSPKKCTRCGATSGSALGHIYTSATCTSPKKCTRCGVTSGNSLGHNYTSATCTSPKKCTRCGITSGSSLGHNYASATCTTPKKCTRCGATTGSSLGHNWQAATYNKPKTCSRCKATEGSALGLSFVFKNTSGYSITELYIYQTGTSKYGKNRVVNNAWIKHGQSSKITMDKSEAAQNTRWSFRILLYSSSYSYMWVTWDNLYLNDMLGKTFHFSSNDGGRTVYFVIE